MRKERLEAQSRFPTGHDGQIGQIVCRNAKFTRNFFSFSVRPNVVGSWRGMKDGEHARKPAKQQTAMAVTAPSVRASRHPHGCGEVVMLLQHLMIKESSRPSRNSAVTNFQHLIASWNPLKPHRYRFPQHPASIFCCHCLRSGQTGDWPTSSNEKQPKPTRHACGLNRSYTNAHHHSREPTLSHHRHKATP